MTRVVPKLVKQEIAVFPKLAKAANYPKRSKAMQERWQVQHD